MKRLVILIVILLAFFVPVASAEANFTAIGLNASDVNCKKCHADSPHIIHLNKPVDCVGCHGDKKSITLPQCTKCHSGLIHQVHGGKVSTQKCDYCHRNLASTHGSMHAITVCSHCHKDLFQVHGETAACAKCHLSPPDIVKPVKLEGTVIVCQNCHKAESVASIHGQPDNRQPCYNCHRGAKEINGSQVPHLLHAKKVSCTGCHGPNVKITSPQCTNCHNISDLHSFQKIALGTSLRCQKCHPEESR